MLGGGASCEGGGDEVSLVPFKNCAFPMNMSAEQKCLNVGGGCKVAERFCTKCSCRSSKLAYFWEQGGQKRHCGICEELGVGNDNVTHKCWHYPVDDVEEIQRKRTVISGKLGVDKLHLEETEDVKKHTKVLHDPSLEDKKTNVHHIDFDSSAASPQLKTAFSNVIDGEFKLRNWQRLVLCGGVMKIRSLADKVMKLKSSILEGEMISQLRDSVTHNDTVKDGYLFPLSLAIPCILHLENRVNEKVIMMLILEGMKHRSGVKELDEYFDQLQHLLNNGVMHEKDGQWRLPMEQGKLQPVSFSNSTARKIVGNILQLFDLVFKNHSSDSASREKFKVCITDKYHHVIEMLRKRKDF